MRSKGNPGTRVAFTSRTDFAQRIPKHPTLIRRLRDARLKQLRASRPVLAASLVRIAKHCGRLGCHCQRGRKHVGHYLTYKQQGKTHTVYVPHELLPEVQAWIAEHRRLRRLTQEVSGLNLEHAYSWAPENMKGFYYLLQIAHMMLQLLEKGSLLQQLVREHGESLMQVFGSLKNLARWLLDCLRYFVVPAEAVNAEAARRCQARFDDS